MISVNYLPLILVLYFGKKWFYFLKMYIVCTINQLMLHNSALMLQSKLARMSKDFKGVLEVRTEVSNILIGQFFVSVIALTMWNIYIVSVLLYAVLCTVFECLHVVRVLLSTNITV